VAIHGYLLAVVAAVLWGLLYVLDERLLAGMSIYRLYFLHSIAGVVVAGAVLIAQGESPTSFFRLSWPGVAPRLVLTTMAVVALACLAIFASIQSLGAARAAVLEISYPLFVAAFAWLLYRHPVQWPVIIGGIFIFIGSAIIVTWARDEPKSVSSFPTGAPEAASPASNPSRSTSSANAGTASGSRPARG
jgi:drug/metabolite transporter (DMT)-like permease